MKIHLSEQAIQWFKEEMEVAQAIMLNFSRDMADPARYMKAFPRYHERRTRRAGS